MIGDELRARTRQFALDVISPCVKLGSEDLGRLVRPQLLRAGSGVAANYRAACRARSRREFTARLATVIEETDEAELWLDILESQRHGPQDAVRRLRREAAELRAILSKSRSTVLAKAEVHRTMTRVT